MKRRRRARKSCVGVNVVVGGYVGRAACALVLHSVCVQINKSTPVPSKVLILFCDLTALGLFQISTKVHTSGIRISYNIP